MNNSLLNPTRTIAVNGQEVEIRELRAIDALAFAKLLAEQLSRIAGAGQQLVIDLGKLVELVAASEQLSNFLVLKSTGRPAAWLAEITLADYLDVLEAAIELNLREDLQKKFVALGGRVARILNLQKTTLPGPSSGSSLGATAPPPGTTPPDSSTGSSSSAPSA
ncbi:MAG TPA: hypothetical protein VNO52_01420 [Methylomirabilota bacterium]|nr:hypothetical protein [Methylomirabilota bacterium]